MSDPRPSASGFQVHIRRLVLDPRMDTGNATVPLLAQQIQSQLVPHLPQSATGSGSIEAIAHAAAMQIHDAMMRSAR